MRLKLMAFASGTFFWLFLAWRMPMVRRFSIKGA